MHGKAPLVPGSMVTWIDDTAEQVRAALYPRQLLGHHVSWRWPHLLYIHHLLKSISHGRKVTTHIFFVQKDTNRYIFLKKDTIRSFFLLKSYKLLLFCMKSYKWFFFTQKYRIVPFSYCIFSSILYRYNAFKHVAFFVRYRFGSSTREIAFNFFSGMQHVIETTEWLQPAFSSLSWPACQRSN